MKQTVEIKRMWVNQPSSLQKNHALHGTLVLAQAEDGKTCKVWFIEGDVINQQLPIEALSEGWPSHLRK